MTLDDNVECVNLKDNLHLFSKNTNFQKYLLRALAVAVAATAILAARVAASTEVFIRTVSAAVYTAVAIAALAASVAAAAATLAAAATAACTAVAVVAAIPAVSILNLYIIHVYTYVYI